MIILATDVLSETMQTAPLAAVVAWLDRQPPQSIWTTAVTIYEVRMGIALLAQGRRREQLEASFARAHSALLEGRVLPFDADATGIAAELAATRQRRGFTVGTRDTQIAGITLARRATLATRNVRDFRNIGANVVNPWEAV